MQSIQIPIISTNNVGYIYNRYSYVVRSLYFLIIFINIEGYMHDFIMVFPYIPMLYPGLVHYFQYYPSFFTCLLKITSTGFNVLYS
jgi:hypothetical protein